jgi:hypothetical protein
VSDVFRQVGSPILPLHRWLTPAEAEPLNP